MRLTDFRLVSLPGKSQLLRLETADGLVGWGEPILEGRPRTTATAVEELWDAILEGADPLRIEDHWQAMYRGGFYRGGPILMSAIAGIDQALWDLKGKHHGAPAHELLGGPVRDRVRTYRWLHGETPAEIAADAEAGMDAGFRSFKMNAVTAPLRRTDTPARVQAVTDRVAAARDTVGEERDLAVDFHGRVSTPMARQLLAALEPVSPLFVEEPVLPEQRDTLPMLAAETSIPIAAGERLHSRWDFRPLLVEGAIHVAQPDCSHAGGITEVHKIAAMAEAADVALAPHCPLGPVALAASLQIDACVPNALIQEQTALDGGLPDWVANPGAFALDGEGFIPRLDGPGIGIEIDEDGIERVTGEPWGVPQWRHDDGSVAEW